MMLPYLFYLLFLPARKVNSKLDKIVTSVIFFIFVYANLFGVVAEQIFWDEFNSAFNFIAVDYLVYTHEVIENIYQSYPVNALLLAILIVSLIIFKLSYRFLFSDESDVTFGKRLVGVCCYVLVLVLSYYSVDMTKLEWSSNRFNNEAGKQGTFSLFSAFLKNELDYKTFYPVRDEKANLELLKKNTVDIVITDVMMPVMDGVKLCKNIKQNVSTSHIPVIMLSAKTDLSDQKEALGTGADDYIPKPFSLSLVISKIQNMMRTRRRMLEHYSRELTVEPEKVTFNPVDEELLKKAVEIVKKNLDNTDFSTEDFASQMNMSRSNLHLKLKAITGESAIEFIKKIRFSEACCLLKEGRYNIAEISSMVGFSTPSYFATSFKKYIGCLPTEYIKQQK